MGVNRPVASLFRIAAKEGGLKEISNSKLAGEQVWLSGRYKANF